QAQDAAEYRDRRRGRGFSAADRLGRCDGVDRPAAGDALPPHLPVDPAALLGARAVRALRLCRGGHPDDAGGRGRAVDPAPDSFLCADHGGGGDCALAARICRRALWLGGDAAVVLLRPALGPGRAAADRGGRQDAARKALVRLFGRLSFPHLHRGRHRPYACAMPDDPAPEPFDEAEYRRRQRSRANLMAWILGGLALLFFLITMARMVV